MPTYEYQCTRCDHAFEEFKPINAPKRQRCPRCRGKVERLISGGSGILFKGSGFYVTDSRSASKRSTGSDKSATETTKPSTGDKVASNGANGKQADKTKGTDAGNAKSAAPAKAADK